jgi:hypothetical protein
VFKWRIMTFPESFKNVKINIWLKKWGGTQSINHSFVSKEK